MYVGYVHYVCVSVYACAEPTYIYIYIYIYTYIYVNRPTEVYLILLVVTL
jgi:hypothetical protein